MLTGPVHRTLSPADEFAAYCLELLSPLGTARAKKMFGGHGLYVDDLFIALIAEEQLYLKVNDDTQPAFEAAACRPFVYKAEGREIRMSYWTAPIEAMESPALMRPWARLALEAALRARQAKAVRPPKAKNAPGQEAAQPIKPGSAAPRKKTRRGDG